jgi:hypothetical protein
MKTVQDKMVELGQGPEQDLAGFNCSAVAVEVE